MFFFSSDLFERIEIKLMKQTRGMTGAGAIAEGRSWRAGDGDGGGGGGGGYRR